MLIDLVMAGLKALQDYVATHVLTCFVPAFLLAGAMVNFVRQEAVLALTCTGRKILTWSSMDELQHRRVDFRSPVGNECD